MTEGDLEAQIAEICAEAGALTDERERLQNEWERARDSQGALESAEQLLDRLRLKLDASEDELSWETKRRIVEELVAGIEVESRFDVGAPRGKQRTAIVRITYRFEATDANRPARGKRNNGTLAASRDAMDEENSSGLSLVKQRQMHSSPSAATDRMTLPDSASSVNAKPFKSENAN